MWRPGPNPLDSPAVRTSPSVLRLYYFLSFAALGAYVPFFPPWLEARGIHGLAMSSITALLPFVGLASPVAFGVASDALGLRGSLLCVASFGALAPFVLLAVASAAHVPLGYGAIFAAVALFALFRTPVVMLADVMTLESGSSYGATRLFGSLGFLLTAAFGGRWLGGTRLAPLPVAVAIGLALAFAVSTMLRAPRAHATEPVLDGAGQLFRSGAFRLFLGVTLLWGMSHAAYDLCFSLDLRDLGAKPSVIGAYWAVGVVAEIALMSVSSRLVTKFGSARLIVFGLAVVGLRWALVASVSSLTVLLWLQPLHALTFGLVWVAALGYTKEHAPAHVLATAQSLFSIATGIGAGVGMLTWGALYAAGKGPVVFTVAAAVAGAGGVLSLFLAPARATTSAVVASDETATAQPS